MPDVETAQTLPQGLTRATKRYHSYPTRGENAISIKILQTSELKKRKIHHRHVMIVCVASIQMLLPICLEEFNCLFLSLSKNFQTFQQHFPLGKFTESNDTTFLDRRRIRPLLRKAVPGRATWWRGGRKTQLEKHRRSLSTSQKNTQGARFKVRKQHCAFSKGRKK